MSDHYYSEKPTVRHQRQHIDVAMREHTLKFITDAGVFSKERVDYGSSLLIKHMSFPARAHVLDVGCGYGPIGLFAAKLAEEGTVTMVDVNERAVSLARENAKLNGVTNVDIMQSDLFSSLQGRMFTTIVTNPPIRAGKQIVHRIYEEAQEHLEDGGELWVVIQKKQGAASTLQKLQLLYAQVEEVAKSKGYRLYKATHIK